ncbi:MAG TPA: DUF222 domain-containing protein [Nocardioides sp.]
MTGVGGCGDGSDVLPDWLERAFATGEWPSEAEMSYDDSPAVLDSGAAAGSVMWGAPGVEVPGGSDLDRGHPVLEAISEASRALSDVADGGLLGEAWLSAGQTGAALVEVQRLISQASALAAGLLRHAESVELPRVNGSVSAAVWFANATNVTRREASRLARIGTAVGATTSDGLGEAFTAGAVTVEQADVIVRALAELPDDLDAETRVEAERTLVGYAADHDAKALRILGKRILTVVAPEVGEAHDAAALEREERQARARARLTMVSDGHGSVHGRFTLPELHGAMLRKALDAYAAPAHANTAADPDDRFRPGRPTPERQGEAFCELLETLTEKDLPDAGGTGATVVVTMTLETLLGGLAAASLDTGGLISASEARRLACTAGVIPAVLGGPSEVLDIGRAGRFHTKAMRVAMAIRDGGCTAEGCDRPPHQCQAHHDQPWAAGGGTSVKDGRLLCAPHHRLVHDPRYRIERLPTGRVRFTRRE